MRKVCVVFLAVAVVLAVNLAASTAQAQGRGGQGRGGFRGMMGGGMMGGGAGNLLGLLRVEQVREELDIMPEQETKLTALQEEMRGQRGARGQRGQGGQGGQRPSFRDMSQEEREKAFADMRQQQVQRDKETREKLVGILMDDQMVRLEEISLQARGVAALADAHIQAKLGVTDEATKEKISAAFRDSQAEMRSEIQSLMQGGNREGMREKMQELRKKVESSVLGVLSKEQKATYEELKGDPFEMPQRTFGGQRGQRGARGQRGQGGNRNLPQRPI